MPLAASIFLMYIYATSVTVEESGKCSRYMSSFFCVEGAKEAKNLHFHYEGKHMVRMQQSIFSFFAQPGQEPVLLKNVLRSRRLWLSLLVLLVIGALLLFIFTNMNTKAPGNIPAIVKGRVSVLTFHYDNLRTGQNRQETMLTTNNVNQAHFGLLSSHTMEGQVQAQPLYVPNVAIHGRSHNVVYVATTTDHVYAFDAASSSDADPLWDANLGLSGGPGIFGTPVIAAAHGVGTLYVVTNDGTATEHLHALDIASGQERAGSPVLIGVPGFNPATTHERTGLLLLHGVVYGGWSASEFTDKVEHGWLLGFNADTLQLVSAFNTTPDSTLPKNPGSIWQSTSALAADTEGNIYPIVGNGPFDVNKGGSSYGDSFVKLSTNNNKLAVTDYFTPFNQDCLLQKDFDLGSGGNLLLPDQTDSPHTHLMFSASKIGGFYLVDRDNLGRFRSDPALQCGSPEEGKTGVDNIVQEGPAELIPGLFMAPTYWLGPAGQQFIYVSGANADSGQGDNVKAFLLHNGKLDLTPASQSTQSFGYPGAGFSVSSNGSQPGSGILWALQPGRCHGGGCTPAGPAILHAYAATNLHVELYNSEQNAARDGMDSSMKFTLPVVADGKVFACSQDTLYIYGLL